MRISILHTLNYLVKILIARKAKWGFFEFICMVLAQRRKDGTVSIQESWDALDSHAAMPVLVYFAILGGDW